MADNKRPNTDPETDVAAKYDDTNQDNAGGITNRPFDEEVENQESLPPRGSSRDESGDTGVGEEVDANDERRSDR